MGYIKLDRKMLEWGWFSEPETAHLWVYILLNANFKENEWRGETYEVGSFPASIEKISVETGLSIQTVRTGLKRLEKTGEITRHSTNLGTKISVVKWAEYQGCDEEANIPSNKQLTNDQQTNNKQLTTLEEYKKERREEFKNNNTYAPSPNELKAVAKLPLNQKDTFHYITEEDIAHYKELYPAVNVEQEIRNMVGWCEANPTKRKTKSGAPRFINTWLSKAQDRGGHEKKGGFTFFDIDGNLPSLE